MIWGVLCVFVNVKLLDCYGLIESNNEVFDVFLLDAEVGAELPDGDELVLLFFVMLLNLSSKMTRIAFTLASYSLDVFWINYGSLYALHGLKIIKV